MTVKLFIEVISCPKHPMTRIGAFLASILLLTAAFAHDLYLMPVRFVVTEGAELTVGLYNGDSFPESEISPVLERVRDMKLISGNGSWDVQNLHVAGNAVLGDVRIPQAASFILTARTIPNAFRLDAKEFTAYLREEGLGQALLWRQQHGESRTPGRERYAKYAKSLLTTGGTNEFHTRPVGLAIEIVPEISPYDLKPGAELLVRILFHGKPMPGLQVETAQAVVRTPRKTTIVGRTDGQGRIVIPNVSSGKWRIHAVFMERCKETTEADWESSWASLTFELP